MSIVQVMFEVPQWVEEGIVAGDYQIFGGVVRKLNGEIVYHLKDIFKVADKEAEKVVENNASNLAHELSDSSSVGFLEKVVSNKNKVLIIGGLVVVITIAGVVIVKSVKNKNSEKKEYYNAVDKFKRKFTEYVFAARMMELNSDIINELSESVEEIKIIVKKSRRNKIIKEAFDLQQFAELINSIHKLTIDLVEKNMSEAEDFSRSTELDIESNIVDLQNYLNIQRKVFEIGA